MKTNYTPGPWKVLHTPTRKETFWAVATHIDAPTQAVIALVDGISKYHQEEPERAKANAALIAAAPDLVEACMSALKYLEEHRPRGNVRKIFGQLNEHENGAVKPLRAALEKAGVEL